MINLNEAKLRRIKRANTDWWINSKAVVADNGLTYIAYYTDTGEIHVKELDAKCRQSISRDVRLCDLNCAYADEHNSPSICVLKSGRIIVGYTGHNVKHLKYRVTTRPYDISSFGEERHLPYDGPVTYVQMYENTKRGELWLFSRVNGHTWAFRCSKDEGESWSCPRIFLNTDPDPGEQFVRYVNDASAHVTAQERFNTLFYVDVRKQHVVTKQGEDEQFFFALYGHPYKSTVHSIRCGIFNSDGKLVRCDGTPDGLDLYEEGAPLNISALDMVYEAPEKTSSRLLDVSSTLPLRVAFASFTVDDIKNPDPTKPTYYGATYRDGKWCISDPICRAGEFLAKDMDDGSQTYLGGMAYYYGVGTLGGHFGEADLSCTDTDRLYIARFDGEARVLESYVTRDFGAHYTHEQTIRRIPAAEGIKIWRPTVPVHAQDNLPVYWHEGTYTAHTGGWHCDAVMLVEYDD